MKDRARIIRATLMGIFSMLVMGIISTSCSQNQNIEPQSTQMPLPATGLSPVPMRPFPSNSYYLRKDLLLVQINDGRSVAAQEEESDSLQQPVASAEPNQIKPFRTFVTLENYEMFHNGEAGEPLSKVKLEVEPPNAQKFEVPGDGEYWVIGNGQKQEINQTYEIPWQFIEKDGFKLKIQMVRKGSWFKPCEFKVSTLSAFNRQYVCKVDVEWQRKKGIADEKIERQAIMIRVFTDKNSPKKEIPQNAIALR